MFQAVANVASCLLVLYLTQGLMIDVTAFVVYFLGQSVARGSRRAAKWSLGFMVLWVLMSAMMLVGIAFAPERMRMGGKPVAAEALPWMQWAFVVLASWSAVCAGLLVRGLRETQSDPARPRSSGGAFLR